MDSSSKPKADAPNGDFGAQQRLRLAIADLTSLYAPALPLAVAISGGPDSAAMAICAAEVGRRLAIPLTLFHIHHGLMAEADDWADRVGYLAGLLEVPLVVERVKVDLSRGLGVEAAARLARHAALLRLAQGHGVGGLLFAHHQQDQAETVLMRLLRGAGPTGLAAMRPAVQRGGVWFLRPWLAQARRNITGVLKAFEQDTGWVPVDDPSNRDPALGRGTLRERLAPVLGERWPGWISTLARHAEQAAQANDLLTEYGRELLQRLVVGDQKGLSLTAWRSLRCGQQTLVLRQWFADQDVPMPTERRLGELVRQLATLHQMGHDRALRWCHGNCEVTCVRGLIKLHAKI